MLSAISDKLCAILNVFERCHAMYQNKWHSISVILADIDNFCCLKFGQEDDSRTRQHPDMPFEQSLRSPIYCIAIKTREMLEVCQSDLIQVYKHVRL